MIEFIFIIRCIVAQDQTPPLQGEANKGPAKKRKRAPLRASQEGADDSPKSKRKRANKDAAAKPEGKPKRKTVKKSESTPAVEATCRRSSRR